jgi:hypothetical protein
MNRRRLAFLSIAVVIVLCVVGVAIVAVAAGGSALAYEVNGTRVSQRTVNDQLDALANNELAKSQSHTQGSLDSVTTARLLNTNIIRDLLRNAVNDRNVTVSDADRSTGTATARASLGANYSRLPSGYRQLITDLYTYTSALGLKDDTSVNSFLSKQISKADVHVNPKYGFWNPRYGVCPPTGCQALAQPGGNG